jgi:hypothetical protein
MWTTVNINMAIRIVDKFDNNSNWLYPIIVTHQNIEVVGFVSVRQPIFVYDFTFKPFLTCKMIMFSYPALNLRSEFHSLKMYFTRIRRLSCLFRTIPQTRGLVKALRSKKTSRILKTSLIYDSFTVEKPHSTQW